MDNITVESLHENLAFTGDLMIDSSFVVLPQTAPISKTLIELLKKWQFENFYCEGGLSLGGDIGISGSGSDEEKAKNNVKIGESVKKVLENSKSALPDNSDNARMAMVQNVYNEYMNYIESVFTHYATHKEIDHEELSETVKDLCVFIKENRRFVLRINPTLGTNNKNFLVIHSMRTTVIAIAIALQLRMPISKMIELGVTCIIHEIGMLRLPPQIYMSDKKLTPGEKSQIYKHPVLGFTIAKDLSFPLIVQLGILEHHEKENGTGYPQKKTGDKISTNSKIISVACSYEAITSPRSYKDERSTFEAIVELIQNRQHAYDDAIIKALLFSVSLYPIGSYVYLTNHKVGIVIDSNPDNPKLPIVQYVSDFNEDGSPIVIQTGAGTAMISRILTKSEQADIIKITEEKYQAIQEAQKAAQEQEKQNIPQKRIVITNSNRPDMNHMEEVDINTFE
ncbi:MAG: HD domain-containing protein [Treponema sp.]|nr:HD domain-containing protein [Treponema sp.]